MGDKPAGLHGIIKMRRNCIFPVLKRFYRREMIKRTIELYRVKILLIVFQELRWLHPFRVKRAHPVFVMKSGATNMYFPFSGHPFYPF
jgi:hypothetical protein